MLNTDFVLGIVVVNFQIFSPLIIKITMRGMINFILERGKTYVGRRCVTVEFAVKQGVGTNNQYNLTSKYIVFSKSGVFETPGWCVNSLV